MDGRTISKVPSIHPSLFRASSIPAAAGQVIRSIAASLPKVEMKQGPLLLTSGGCSGQWKGSLFCQIVLAGAENLLVFGFTSDRPLGFATGKVNLFRGNRKSQIVSDLHDLPK